MYTKGTLTLARLGREAPIAAASPAGAGAPERRGRQPRRARALSRGPPDPAGEAAEVAGDRHRRPGAVRAARRHRRAAQAAPESGVPDAKEDVLQTPAAFEYERATSVEGAIASLERLGPEARDHRRRSQPAADDEAASGEPRVPGRHQRPRTSSPTSARRDGEIRIGALTRHVELERPSCWPSAFPSSATPSR